MSRSTAAGCVVALIVMAHAAPALAQTGTILGTVTNASTSQPASGFMVVFCRGTASAPTCVTGTPNAQGAYSITLPAGTYYGYTSGLGPLINQVYEGMTCPRNYCGEAQAIAYGTPTAVASGQVIERSFRLQPPGRIRGVVRDAVTGAGLASVQIDLLGAFQGQLTGYGQAMTDATGAYTIGNLPPGNYYAISSQSQGYVDQFFGDVWCPGQCSGSNADSGAPIGVMAGADVGGRDFALRPGGSISGRITGVLSPGSATPVANATVFAYSLLGDQLGSGRGTTTDATGHYTLAGLAGGLYYIQIYPPTTDGLLGQFYGGSPCGQGCGLRLPMNGVPVAVATGIPTTGQDIQLARGGSIAGIVTNAATLLPQQGVSVTASALVDGFPRAFASGSTDASGSFSIPALPPGVYSLSTENTSALVDEVYPDVPCPGRCDPLVASHLTVPVAQYAVTLGQNFALDPAGSIMGLVTDGRTGSPPVDAYVNIYTRAAGQIVNVAQKRPDAAGFYTVPNLSAGTYWAMSVGFEHLRAQVFENIPCPEPDCSNDFVATGTPIVVEPPTPYTGVNFSLMPPALPPRAPFDVAAITSGFRVRVSWRPNRLGSVPSGHILEAGFTPGTTAVTIATTAVPFLEVPGVPPGRYFIRVRATNAFGVGPPSNEYALVVNGNGAGSPDSPQSLIAWMSGRRLNATWIDPVAGERPTDYVVEVGSATGMSNIAVRPVSLRSFSYEPVPDGFYFLRVRARLGANLGPPTREVLVKLGGGPSPPGAPLGWTRTVSGNVVTFRWAAPFIGTPTSYLLEAGTGIGLSDIVAFNTGSPETTFTVGGVPPGTYYVRLRAVNAVGVGPPTFDTVVIVQ